MGQVVRGFLLIERNKTHDIEPATVLFVGGAGDSYSGIMLRLHKHLALPAATRRRYFMWDQGLKLQCYLAQCEPGPVVMIGHSWGAVTALRQGLAAPEPVELLITLDPVSWRRPRLKNGCSPAKRWVNVYVPADRCLRNRNNLIAWVGRHWGEVAQADENHCVLTGDHACAAAMLNRVRAQLHQVLVTPVVGKAR